MRTRTIERHYYELRHNPALNEFEVYDVGPELPSEWVASYETERDGRKHLQRLNVCACIASAGQNLRCRLHRTVWHD